MLNRRWLIGCVVLAAVVSISLAAVRKDSPGEAAFLRRSMAEIHEQQVDFSAAAAHYKPFFGIGDPNSQILRGVVRFGELTVNPGGGSKAVSYGDEEQIYYIVEGAGVLQYGQEKVPVKANDFMYLPVGVEHAIANTSDKPVRVLVMGFKIPAGVQAAPTPKLMLASADDVKLLVLGQHGPTTQFKLLMGDTKSMRDKLAATRQVSSLFIMDFAAGGTNIPHRHNREEEIYYVLRGQGDMVAGSDPNGKEMRYACKKGDAFYFAPNTLVGFYSAAKEGQEHDLIVAVRSRYPAAEAKP